MSALDPTPDDLVWAREWMTTTITADREPHVDMYVLTGVRVMLDSAAMAAAAGERGGADRSVRQARALIVVLAEYRDSDGAR